MMAMQPVRHPLEDMMQKGRRRIARCGLFMGTEKSAYFFFAAASPFLARLLTLASIRSST